MLAHVGNLSVLEKSVVIFKGETVFKHTIWNEGGTLKPNVRPEIGLALIGSMHFMTTQCISQICHHSDCLGVLGVFDLFVPLINEAPKLSNHKRYLLKVWNKWTDRTLLVRDFTHSINFLRTNFWLILSIFKQCKELLEASLFLMIDEDTQSIIHARG